MWKKKLLIQMCICIIAFGGYAFMTKSDNPLMVETSNTVITSMSKHYTLENIWQSGKKAASAIIRTPAVVTSYIIESQHKQEYGDPVDKMIDGETVSVYAVAGGQVIETGENDKIGKYLKIQHQSSVSTYGNCNKLYVKEGERVRKGQIIASFYKDKNGNFYYDLTEVEL